jgi:hypothetical protein
LPFSVTITHPRQPCAIPANQSQTSGSRGNHQQLTHPPVFARQTGRSRAPPSSLKIAFLFRGTLCPPHTPPAKGSVCGGGSARLRPPLKKMLPRLSACCHQSPPLTQQTLLPAGSPSCPRVSHLPSLPPLRGGRPAPSGGAGSPSCPRCRHSHGPPPLRGGGPAPSGGAGSYAV